ncbi:MAG: hypothetical protein EA399_05635 [Desulfovibrionales bacterium]|nr:MAG: hypothetical protein EA399_05635 [Desulfovibrionales bacterium]
MAIQLNDLAWNQWWLDVGTLPSVVGLPVDQSLLLWGELFWARYHRDAVVYLDVGGRRRLVYQAVRRWEADFAHIRFATEHDLDVVLPGKEVANRNATYMTRF